MNLSEARLSYLSHAFLEAIRTEQLGQIRNERLFLSEAKKILADGFSLDGRIDQLARARMPKAVGPRQPRMGRPVPAVLRGGAPEAGRLSGVRGRPA